jgi:DNA-directed RNA polymerase specialized sigma subunit
MTSQEKKQYLNRYTELNRAIKQRLDELAHLTALAEKCTTTLTGMPHGGSRTREDTYAKMVDMSAEIDNQIDAYNHMKDEIEAAIDTVHDLTLQTLLRYKYLDGQTFEQIAVNMNYCYMQICRLHGKALEKIML